MGYQFYEVSETKLTFKPGKFMSEFIEGGY